MRYLTPEITRFFAEESKMAFIAGPRQVGKTTLAKYLLANVGMEALYFNWDIESSLSRTLKVFGRNSRFPLLSRNRESSWTRFTNILDGSDF
jgi:predicted AAA+ superfamily ATPase